MKKKHIEEKLIQLSYTREKKTKWNIEKNYLLEITLCFVLSESTTYYFLLFFSPLTLLVLLLLSVRFPFYAYLLLFCFGLVWSCVSSLSIVIVILSSSFVHIKF